MILGGGGRIGALCGAALLVGGCALLDPLPKPQPVAPAAETTTPASPATSPEPPKREPPNSGSSRRVGPPAKRSPVPAAPRPAPSKQIAAPAVQPAATSRATAPPPPLPVASRQVELPTIQPSPIKPPDPAPTPPPPQDFASLAPDDHRIRPAIRGPACECPFDLTADGKACGDKSEWSRPGGRDPVCYAAGWGKTTVSACSNVRPGPNILMGFCPRV